MIQEIVTTSGLLMLVLAVCFIGPVIALYFLTRRKRVARARRRTPLTANLLRSPGQSIREHLMEAEADLIWDLTQLVALPSAWLAMFFGVVYFRGAMLPAGVIVLCVLGAIGFTGFLIRKLVRAAERLDRLRLGYDGELAVGQQLDQLMREGAYIFHDVPAEKTFNIDHVVVSTRGIFAVETKGFSKPNVPGTEAATVVYDGNSLRFPHFVTSKPLAQAERQAKWVSEWLSSALASNVEAVPVLALPGWWVELRGRGTVRVFSSGQLDRLLQSRNVPPLSEQDAMRAVHRLEERCKTVASQYRDVE